MKIIFKCHLGKSVDEFHNIKVFKLKVLRIILKCHLGKSVDESEGRKGRTFGPQV